MKKRKNIYLYLFIMIALVYIVLLTMLYCSESADSNAKIQSFGDSKGNISVEMKHIKN